VRLSGARAAFPLSPPFFQVLSPFFCSTHFYILLISAEALTSALFVVNQLTAEILLHVIHSIGGLPKTPERYKNVSAIVGAFLFPESR
jgi:hypothetical protein